MSALVRLGPDCPGPRLVCFPYAGGNGDAFAPWVQQLQGVLELWAVTPAGRRHRYKDPLNEDPAVLVSEVMDEVRELTGGPLVLFGHSMGGLIAYEVAAALEREARAPCALVVSATPAPHVRSAHGSRDYTDAHLVDTLADWGGTPSELLGDTEMRELVLPPLRADLRLCDAYCRVDAAALSVPLSALAGTSDAVVPIADVRPWSGYSTQFLGTMVVDGGHFFLHSHQRQVVSHVVQCAELALRSRAQARRPARQPRARVTYPIGFTLPRRAGDGRYRAGLVDQGSGGPVKTTWPPSSPASASLR